MSFLLRLLHHWQVPPFLTGFAQSLLHCTPRSSTQMHFSSEDLVIGCHSLPLPEESDLARDRRLVTIDILPDDVLVEIFDFYVNIDCHCPRWSTPRNTWHALVHACRRWRYLVFASPHRLNLRLEYDGHGPMSEVLKAWPVLPVVLISSVEILPGELPHPKSDQWWDNRVAALESEHYNRICEIHIFDMSNSRWERFAAAMQKPFPELTHLHVVVDGDCVVPVLPDSFLAGPAPRLRELLLRSIPFPSLPNLLLSANVLDTLSLWNIPDSGYISPDSMATALRVMTRLKTLRLRFRSPRSRLDQEIRPLPPPTRFVLPALTKLSFGGVYEYLEDLLARIDAPLLCTCHILFFMDLNFDVPQLHRLISRTEVFKTFDHAEVLIFNHSIQLSLYPKSGHHKLFNVQINCSELDWQLSSLTQVCSPSFPFISSLEELKIREYDFLSSLHWKDDMEDTQWVELLDSFTALKSLYFTDEIARRVCGALQGLSGERAAEVLPALRNLFVDGFRSSEHIQEAIRLFVAARELSGHPVVVDCWKH